MPSINSSTQVHAAGERVVQEVRHVIEYWQEGVLIGVCGDFLAILPPYFLLYSVISLILFV